MADSVLLKIAGLYSFPNRLSSIPSGALLRARNIVINRDSIAESRRGFKLYGTAMSVGANIASQLFTYKNRIFRHWGLASGNPTFLDYDSDGSGTFQNLNLTLLGDISSGSPTVNGFTTTSQLKNGMSITGTGIPTNTTISSVIDNTSITISNNATASTTGVSLVFTVNISEVVNGTRIRSLEQNGNLYFTSSNGIQKISSSSTSNLSSAIITSSGGVKALDLQSTLNSQVGFLPQESTIAYRLVWGIQDANANEILGAPSARTVISNPLTPLLIKDFNNLLAGLDVLALSTGINAQNYSSSFKMSNNSNSTVVRTNLINLASAIDTDISPFTVTGATWTSNVATFTVSSNPTNIISPNDPITISGVVCSPVSPNLYNGSYTVLGVTATTITCTISSTAGTYASGGSVKRTKYASITQPVTLSAAPTTDQLISMQTYYNAIVTQLQNETSGVITSPSVFNTYNATTSSTVNLSFVIPQGINTAYFYQVYRTAITTAATGTSLSAYDPGDDCGLVYESNPTNADLTSGTITIQDVTPDAFRGANLYTNPNSGTGILSSNDIPPLARDIAAFKGYVFYANTSTKQRLSQSMLSVTNLVSGVSSLTVSDGTVNNTYTFTQGLAQIQSITTVADVAANLNGKWWSLSNGKNLTNYYVWYTNGSGVDPAPSGKTGISVTFITNDSASNIATKTQTAINRIGDFIATVSTNVVKVSNTATGLSTAAANGTASPGFSYAVNTTGQGEDATNKKVLFTPAASGLISTISVANPSIITTTSAHGLTTGQLINLSGTNSTPNVNGVFPITVTSSTAFSIPVNVTVAGSNGSWAISPIYTPSQQVSESSQSLIRVINKNSLDIINGFYLSGPSDVPGLLSFEARNLSQSQFYLLTNNSSTGVEFFPTLSPTNTITNISVANPTVITSTAHGLTTGNRIIISGSNSTPSINGTYTVTVINSSTFSIPVNVTILGSLGGFSLVSTAVTSSNEVKPNRIYYSKFQQPEAVPILNYLDVGPQDKNILRIVALRDNLFIFKEEGLYRLSGLVSPFIVYPFDFSTIIKATDSAVVLNNLIYLYSSQGVTKVADTGVEVISRPIEDELLVLLNNPNFNSASFGVAYESDRSYYLFTTTNLSDTLATQCFRFNTFTNSWTNLVLSKHCGIVNPGDDLLYLGPNDTNYIEQERKSFDRTDYADREITLTLGAGAIRGTSITLPSITDVSIGDVFSQTQNLTINQFNQILIKLDIDPLLSSRNYVATLQATSGIDLSASVDSLIDKIANDPGRTGTVSSFSVGTYTALLPTPFASSGQQTTFNQIVALVNSDPGVGYGNYITSTGMTTYEFNITTLNISNNIITSIYPYPILQGDVLIYNNIPIEMQWVPQYLNDVSITKQVSEGTFIFEDTGFSSATISYATDLSGNFEEQVISGTGNGIFGNTVFGEDVFGGGGSGIPFRTYLPLEKQRCRYVNCKFKHATARERFSLYGLSLNFNITSQRGWR